MKRTANDARRRIALARNLFEWTPHSGQRMWMEDEAAVKVAACGRRWGKTEAAAVDTATFALLVPGSRQMLVSPTYDQSRLIFDVVERLIMGSSFTCGRAQVTRTPYPRLKLGASLITARTADEDGRNLRGHNADRVIIDEAAYVRDSVVEEVIGPMLADRNGQLVMISTPFGKNHFYRAFLQGQQPERRTSEAERVADEHFRVAHSGAVVLTATGTKMAQTAIFEEGAGFCHFPAPDPKPARYASYRFPSWDNPHISRDYIEFQRGVVTPRQFSVEYEAEFLDDQASVFPWEMIQSAIALGRSGGVSEEPYQVAGIDWARYSDYTTVIVIDAGASPHRVVAMDRFNGMPWEVQVERAAEVLLRNGVSEVLTDQTSVGDPLLEFLRKNVWNRGAGMAIEGMNFTNTGKREIIDNLVIRLSSGELSIPDDEQLVRELQYFEYELTTSGNVRMNARSGYTDDLVIALALAEYQARTHSGPARFLTSGRSREGSGYRVP